MALRAPPAIPLSLPPPSPPPPLPISPPLVGYSGQQWTDWRRTSMYNRKVFPGYGDTGAS